MCGCHRLGAIGGCVISIRQFGFRRGGAVFICVICVWAIQTSKVYTKTRNQINGRLYAIKL